MHRKIIPLLMFIVQAPLSANGITSKSYFSVVPQYRTYMAVHRSAIGIPQHELTGEYKGFLSACVFASASTNKKELMRYFGLFNKEKLTVKERPLLADSYDIVAKNFNIATTGRNLHSTITFEPTQKYAGFSLNGRKHFRDKWWAEVSIPFISVRNTMGFQEEVVTPGGSAQTATTEGFDNTANAVATMKEAFKQAGMKYGKIDGARTKSGIADIELKVGYNGVMNDSSYWKGYGGLIIPTGNKPKAEYMFEPIYGNGGHFGFMMGNEFGFELKNTDSYTLYLHGTIHGHYLFENTQKRSFDLYGRPWGRFLHVYKNSSVTPATNVTWGINHLTQDVKVHPRSSRAITFSFVFEKENGLCLEGGYGYFYRQAEQVKLAQEWTEAVGIATTKLIPATPLETRFSRAININENVSDGSFVTIKQKDLDLNSASHPTIFSVSFYGAVSKTSERYSHPMHLSLGAGYEVGGSNTTLNRWTLWGKYGVSF